MAEPAVSKLNAAGMASGNHGWGIAATAGHSHCGRGDAHCGNSRCRMSILRNIVFSPRALRTEVVSSRS